MSPIGQTKYLTFRKRGITRTVKIIPRPNRYKILLEHIKNKGSVTLDELHNMSFAHNIASVISLIERKLDIKLRQKTPNVWSITN